MINLNALFLTVKIALMSVLIGIPLAFSLAILVRKYQGVFLKIVETICLLPLALPPVITGFLLLEILGKRGLLQQYIPLKFDIIFTWKSAVIASTVIIFPLIYKPIKVALFSYDRRLEQVAQTLGSSRWMVYKNIIFPITKKGIISGALLGFIRSVGEFGATVMLLGNIEGQRTLSIEIYNLVEMGKEREAYILIGITLLISFVIIIFIEMYEDYFNDTGSFN